MYRFQESLLILILNLPLSLCCLGIQLPPIVTTASPGIVDGGVVADPVIIADPISEFECDPCCTCDCANICDLKCKITVTPSIVTTPVSTTSASPPPETTTLPARQRTTSEQTSSTVITSSPRSTEPSLASEQPTSVNSGTATSALQTLPLQTTTQQIVPLGATPTTTTEQTSTSTETSALSTNVSHTAISTTSRPTTATMTTSPKTTDTTTSTTTTTESSLPSTTTTKTIPSSTITMTTSKPTTTTSSSTTTTLQPTTSSISTTTLPPTTTTPTPTPTTTSTPTTTPTPTTTSTSTTQPTRILTSTTTSTTPPPTTTSTSTTTLPPTTSTLTTPTTITSTTTLSPTTSTTTTSTTTPPPTTSTTTLSPTTTTSTTTPPPTTTSTTLSPTTSTSTTTSTTTPPPTTSTTTLSPTTSTSTTPPTSTTSTTPPTSTTSTTSTTTSTSPPTTTSTTTTTTTSSPTTTSTTSTTLGPCQLTTLELDVVFIIDESLSVTRPNYRKAKKFLADLSKSFPVDSGAVKIATIRYSGVPYFGIHIVHYLNTYSKGSQIAKVITQMPYAGGRTATGEALKVANNLVFSPKKGMRKESLKVVILQTDGRTNEGLDPAEAGAQLLARGIEIFAIGVGNDALLEEIDGIVGDPGNVFIAKDYDQLTALFRQKFFYTLCHRVKQKSQESLASFVAKHDPSSVDEQSPAEQEIEPCETLHKWFETGECQNENGLEDCSATCNSWTQGLSLGAPVLMECARFEPHLKQQCHCVYEPDDCKHAGQIECLTREQWFGGGLCRDHQNLCLAKCLTWSPGLRVGSAVITKCQKYNDTDDLKCRCSYESNGCSTIRIRRDTMAQFCPANHCNCSCDCFSNNSR